MSRILAAAAAVFLLALAPAAPGPHSPAVDAAPAVGIRVSCYANPETTRITNNSSSSIKVKTVGSTYQPYSNEPFWVNRTLAPGTSVTYQTGYAASRNALTRRYIYNNNGLDGARVATTIGTFTKRCP